MPLCGTCTFDSPAGMSFCGRCGAPLVAAADEPERRVLTVMFCDLVGSTALAEGLDPEDLRSVLVAYQESCRRVIEPNGGHIAQYLGDGILVYFGYPQAREDDARRAVQAALKIVEEIARLNQRLAVSLGTPLAVRLGIHTGPVVVGEVGTGPRRDQLALGSAPNLAARLQGLAQPGTVLISDTTRRLVDRFFDCHPQGSAELKGFRQPTAVYQVLRDRGTAGVWSRPPKRATARDAELARLEELWPRVCRGYGHAVLLCGEAGIGKSRLVADFLRGLGAGASPYLEGHCSPFYENTSYHPVIDLLEGHPACAPEGTADDRLDRLEAALVAAGLSPAEHLPLWAGLFSLPLPERYPEVVLTPRQRKQSLIDSLLAFLFALAAEEPLVLVFEDLHWVDPSTLEVLDRLLASCPQRCLLVVLTFRPTFHPSAAWLGGPQVSRIDLGRLDAEQMASVIAGVAGDRSMPGELLERLVSRAEGIPLFAEELTKAVLESDLPGAAVAGREPRGPSPLLSLPATLQSSLEARLDRLGPAKEVAQLASVLGREVDLQLLRGLSALSGDALAGHLDRLFQADLLLRASDTTCLFKHALIQEAAYETLLKESRRRHHRSVVRLLEESFPGTAAVRPELLAHHATAGELVEKAISYWQRAGQRAVERAANREAVHHARQGRALLAQLPEGEGRDRLELDLQTVLGPAWMALSGFAAPEVETAYRRAAELCRRVGPTPHRFPVLWGVVRYHNVRAELATAKRLAIELLDVAEEEGDPSHRLVAHMSLGLPLFHLGEFSAAHEHLAASTALYDAVGTVPQAFLYSLHPGVHGRTYEAYVLWHLGFPGRSLARSAEALALAHEINDPLSLAFALSGAAFLRQFRREGTVARELAERAAEIAREGGFTAALAMARTLAGWGALQEALTAPGVEELRRGARDWAATGSGVAQTHFLTLLAELASRQGDPQAGLDLLAEALALGRTNGERFFEVEIHRLRGELRLAAGASPAMAEDCFLQGLAVARSQCGRSLELRTALSLARLWRGTAREQEGYGLLAETWRALPEDQGTADLAQARDLLALPAAANARCSLGWG